MYWWPTYVTSHDDLFNLFHSEAMPNDILGSYSGADLDEQSDDAANLSDTDCTKAETIFIEAQRKVIADAAAVFVLD